MADGMADRFRQRQDEVQQDRRSREPAPPPGAESSTGPALTLPELQVAHLERQTAAVESTARDVSTIKTIVVLWAALTVLGLVLVIAGIG